MVVRWRPGAPARGLKGRLAQLAPPEAAEQQALATLLDRAELLWCHVPNGGVRHIAAARAMQAAGVKAGVPDILIFTPPPARLTARGVAIEMKRVSGGQLSAAQRAWLAALAAAGWLAHVAKGCDDAIAWLELQGYRLLTLDPRKG